MKKFPITINTIPFIMADVAGFTSILNPFSLAHTLPKRGVYQINPRTKFGSTGGDLGGEDIDFEIEDDLFE